MTALHSGREAPAAALPVRWEGFAFTYPGAAGPALQDLALAIGPGERVVVMGPSGCGKSTLGLTLNGIVPRMTGGEATGRIEVGGISPQDVSLAEIASRVGLVFQDPDAQLCTITTRDEITFGPQNTLVEREEILARLTETAGLVGLGDRLDEPVFDLSGGQKQRVAIASTLVMRPGVVVLDEPTANLDPAGRLEVMRVISGILEDTSMTTIVIEHHPGELLEVCDRLVVMAAGRVVAQGPPREVLRDHGRAIAGLGVRLPPAFALQVELGRAEEPALSAAELDFDALAGPAVAHTVPARAAAVAPEEGRVPTIVVEDVHFSYDGHREVLRGVDLVVGQGETIALLGANGSGKSTLASLLVGLNRPSSGRVAVCGADTARLPVREIAQRVGYVFQYPEHQFVTDRVVDEVLFSLRRLADVEDVERTAREQLQRFDLADLAERHPLTLSMGQKRRLSIAAMSVYRPDVLLLDEPTFGQDQGHTDDFAEILRASDRSEGCTVMITHDLRLTAELADRAVVMAEGRIVFDDEPRELLRLLRDEPRWSLSPIEEYTMWEQVALRRPGTPFSVRPADLAAAVRGTP